MLPKSEVVKHSCFFAQKVLWVEGKRLVLDEILVDKGLKQNIEDHLLLYELQEGILLKQILFFLCWDF